MVAVSGHAKASPTDGVRALKPCQTSFHTPTRDHDDLQLAEEHSNNFLFKTQILREKGLSTSEEVSLPTGTSAWWSLLTDAELNGTTCHCPLPSRRHALLCELAQLCTRALSDQKPCAL